MSGQDDSADKSFEPTAQKLLEARKKGEVAKSTDLLTAASYLGLLVALTASGAWMMQRVGNGLTVLLDQPDRLAPLFFGSAAAPLAGGLMQTVFAGLSPIFTLPAIGVLVALLAQRAIVFAPEKIKPKGSRISILSNAKNKYGRAGLFEFFKSFVKLLIFSACLAVFIRVWLSEMIGVIQGARSQRSA
ncbi:EscU/YscU/HrcU family type III secretion system export apparatus switch protein [Sulfitobacter albidus]|uniref:EscU/YscU/HrcU family type III secretion system export apparatus switch protein n=1 Tax=Sulfitobacter albidus TaxID=2829501 RepID=UPI0032AFCA4A